MKIYVWTNGDEYRRLPKVFRHATPITEAWWTAHGGLIVERPDPVNLEDYDRVMEARLMDERRYRGYTTRDPSEYLASGVSRWAADARAWVAFRDRVMLYGLSVLNAAQAGEGIPSLREFEDALDEIECEWPEEPDGTGAEPQGQAQASGQGQEADE